MKRRGSVRRVCVVTGTRAEYGLLRTVLRALRRQRGVRPQLLVTGTHLLRKFGHTIDEIRADAFRIDATVRMQAGADDAIAEAEAVGRGVTGIARAIERLRSDVVVVLGDRIEAFAAASAAACARRFVAHLHGGDRAVGDVDDSLRHAISKLAHIHFAATEDAARRLRRMGEPASRVFCVGAPGLDEIRAIRRPSKAWLRERLGWPDLPEYAVVAQHPCGRSPATEARDMAATLSAVARAGLAGVVTYPNSDPGHSGIIEAINRVCGASSRPRGGASKADRGPWRVQPSMGRDDFIRILKGALVIVGNSSSGIIESATAGVPAVNIGPRQKGRLRCGKGVVEARYGEAPVLAAVRRALHVRVEPDNNVYGDGRTGRRVAQILGRLDLSEAFRQKLIRY